MALRAVLISTYELGRQPFGLASPAAWLRQAGVDVSCFDISRQELPATAIQSAELLALYVPMHTATRLTLELLPRLKAINARAHYCCYGLYASVNAQRLHEAGVHTVIAGEFEAELTALARRLSTATTDNSDSEQPTTITTLERQSFVRPDRSGLPALARYAGLVSPDGSQRVVGYTEASRGCKHLCRHCPIVPVYHGKFRVVQKDVVLDDIRQQVSAGAEHITFGDPDFFNGPRHSLDIVRELHSEFPALTYDVTIKVEHLVQHAAYLPVLRDTGCVLITSAVESFDDRILSLLEKGHTRGDFIRALELVRAAGLNLTPTFVSFTPWTTLEGYCELLESLRDFELANVVAPIQLGIRLLIPAGSRLLELPDRTAWLRDFDASALSYRWKHPDPRVDKLCELVQAHIARGIRAKRPHSAIFHDIEQTARAVAGLAMKASAPLQSRCSIPYLNEPWFC